MSIASLNRTTEVEEFRPPLEAAQVLKESCENSQICRFQLVQSEFSNSAVLLSFNDDQLEIRLSEKEGDTQLIPAAICCLSFAYAATYCAFLGHLVTIRRTEPGYVRCTVSVPRQLTVTNLRRSFRVPVSEDSGLKTTIRTPVNLKLKVTACGITEGGMEIEVPSADARGLAVGMMIDVELNFRDEFIERKAEIRRVDENHFGLAFNNSESESFLRHKSQMRALVLSLQQLWLRTRLKG